jgi:hypothetical protein
MWNRDADLNVWQRTPVNFPGGAWCFRGIADVLVCACENAATCSAGAPFKAALIAVHNGKCRYAYLQWAVFSYLR